MLHVCNCSGKTTASASNSTFVNFMNSESSIVSHMELTLFKQTCDYKTLKKTVFIFIGYEYTIDFFDYGIGRANKITGRVDSINGDNSNQMSQSLTVTYLNKPNDSVDDNTVSVTRGPICGCQNKPNNDKYNTTTTVTIPISNITDVCYTGNNPIDPENKPKKGVEVVLLGISAEMVRAVAINLKMIDDNADEAVKDIFMKVGGIYNIAYIDPAEKSMYEITGRLLAISETENKVSTSNSVVRQCANEQYGLNNSIYNTGCNCECGSTDKDDFMNSDTIEKEVLLTMDCSMDFSGHYHTIKLSTIRDCSVVDESGVKDPTDGTEMDCGCTSQPIVLKSGNTKVTIDPVSQNVAYSGGACSFGNITLQELVDFYFGN